MLDVSDSAQARRNTEVVSKVLARDREVRKAEWEKVAAYPAPCTSQVQPCDVDGGIPGVACVAAKEDCLVLYDAPSSASEVIYCEPWRCDSRRCSLAAPPAAASKWRKQRSRTASHQEEPVDFAPGASCSQRVGSVGSALSFPPESLSRLWASIACMACWVWRGILSQRAMAMLSAIGWLVLWRRAFRGLALPQVQPTVYCVIGWFMGWRYFVGDFFSMVFGPFSRLMRRDLLQTPLLEMTDQMVTDGASPSQAGAPSDIDVSSSGEINAEMVLAMLESMRLTALQVMFQAWREKQKTCSMRKTHRKRGGVRKRAAAAAAAEAADPMVFCSHDVSTATVGGSCTPPASDADLLSEGALSEAIRDIIASANLSQTSVNDVLVLLAKRCEIPVDSLGPSRPLLRELIRREASLS